MERGRAADLGREAAERARHVAEGAVGAAREAVGQATSESSPDLGEQRGQG